jgi:hypothetical protein
MNPFGKFGPALAHVKVQLWVHRPRATDYIGAAFSLDWINPMVMSDVQRPTFKLMPSNNCRRKSPAAAEMSRSLNQLVRPPLQMVGPASSSASVWGERPRRAAG